MTPFEQAAQRVHDEGTSPHDEATSLVAEMTLDEKLGCLDGDIDAWPGLFGMMAGAYHRQTFPAAVVPRLGIPGIQFSDGPRGCVIGEKTAFPVSMARGATWDVELEERIGAAIGAELRTVGATYYGGVCVNLLRHPGWGRAQETYGEEPMLVGEMGRALMLGAQRFVMACVKHFAVNSMENARFKVDVHADERALHEVYLPHFRRIVESGVASVMSSYNALNGTFCGDHHGLLTDVLRDEWGFDGFVTSDFIFGLRDAVASVHAGLDIEMPFRQQRLHRLPAAVDDGRLPIDVVDTCIARIVATLLRFHPIVSQEVDPAVVLSPAHRALAREAATKSIVLLQNDGGVLPLDANGIGSVAVLGRLARVPNLGDKGSSEVFTTGVVTPLDGLRVALPGAVVVHSDRDASIVEDADAVVVVVGYTFADEGEFIDASGTAALMGTHFPEMTDADRAAIAEVAPPRDVRAAPAAPVTPVGTGEPDPNLLEAGGFAAGGDRRQLTLSSDDVALITAAAARHPRVVVVMMGGSASVIEAWRHHVPSIVQLWYPGVEGGHALADVLLGRANPSGRLPFSIPTDEAHLPHWDPDAETELYDLWHGHWKLARDGHPAAFPFGFGLSYTRFSVDAIECESDPEAAAPPPHVVVTVSNIGDRDGDTVVQVYGGVPSSRFERPERRLVGFQRVSLTAGETRRVDVPIDVRQLDVRVGATWVREGGRYVLTAAQHAEDPVAVAIDLDVNEYVRSAHGPAPERHQPPRHRDP